MKISCPTVSEIHPRQAYKAVPPTTIN